MIMGTVGRRLWPRSSWDNASEGEVLTTLVVSIGYLVAIRIAVDAAGHHPALRVWLPGCFAAGVLAGSAGLAYGITSYGQANLCRLIFFGMAAVYVGILLELKTGVFLHWILLVSRYWGSFAASLHLIIC